ncbi:MAG TPA: hypothetical protein VH589_18425 [Trebonia sp.]
MESVHYLIKAAHLTTPHSYPHNAATSHKQPEERDYQASTNQQDLQRAQVRRNKGGKKNAIDHQIEVRSLPEFTQILLEVLVNYLEDLKVTVSIRRMVFTVGTYGQWG